MKHWLLITLGVVLSGCGKFQPGASAEDKPAAAPHPGAISFLALGDSYTIGESVAPSRRWPVQLAEMLRKGGRDVGDPTIVARTGWTTGDLSAALDREDLKGPYGLVGLLIGVNNQYQGRSEAEYHTQFVDLLQRAIELAGRKPQRVIVLSIPDWGVTPFAAAQGSSAGEVGAAIDRFNAINKAETEKAGAAYVDITPISRARRDQIADDGLHPSGDAYAEWAKAATPAAEKALGK